MTGEAGKRAPDLGQDKRTGTFGRHVIDGVEDLQEPSATPGFRSELFSSFFQWLVRDLRPEGGR